MTIITFIFSMSIGAWVLKQAVKQQNLNKPEKEHVQNKDTGETLRMFFAVFCVCFVSSLMWFLAFPVLILSIPCWFVYKWVFGVTTEQVFKSAL